MRVWVYLSVLLLANGACARVALLTQHAAILPSKDSLALPHFRYYLINARLSEKSTECEMCVLIFPTNFI